jgi:hypothetical protein
MSLDPSTDRDESWRGRRPGWPRSARTAIAHRKTEALRRGWAEVPPSLDLLRADRPTLPPTGDPARILLDPHHREAARPLRAACPALLLRSILIAEGESPAYVQRMLGHSSIKLPADLYGKWLPTTGRGSERLDNAPSASKMVAARGGGAQKPKISDTSGAQPPKSFFSDSRKPPTSGPCSSPEETRWYSSRSSRCLPVSFRGTSTTTV